LAGRNSGAKAFKPQAYNLTLADVYLGRGQTILLKRESIKRQAIANCRMQHREQAAECQTQIGQSASLRRRRQLSKTRS
jgi:hypothetical protein